MALARDQAGHEQGKPKNCRHSANVQSQHQHVLTAEGFTSEAVLKKCRLFLTPDVVHLEGLASVTNKSICGDASLGPFHRGPFAE